MGLGESQEAEFDLVAGIPAGTYALVCDGIILRGVDVTFEILRRRGDEDTTIGAQMVRFEPRGGGNFDAVPCDLTFDAPALDYMPGDELIFRYSGANTTGIAYVPNGDGAITNGRIPNITLPQ